MNPLIIRRALASIAVAVLASAAIAVAQPASSTSVKPKPGVWTGKTAQKDPLTGGKLPIEFAVQKTGAKREVGFFDAEAYVKCKGQTGRLPSPLSFSPVRVKKGKFVARAEHGGPIGYSDVIRGKFSSAKKASGWLRSEWTGDRTCDSGRVDWSARLEG